MLKTSALVSFHGGNLTLINSFDTAEFPLKKADVKIMTYHRYHHHRKVYSSPLVQFEMASNIYPSHRLSQKVAKCPKLRRLSRDLLLEILDAIADFLKETDLSVNS